MVALPSWIRRLQPVLCGMVMSPGTANRLRLSSFAQPAVLSAPERARACATIRVDDKAAIRRLRSRNRLASGTVPGHSSEIKAPEWLSICSNRFWLLFGPIWFSPPANTATVRPRQSGAHFVHGFDRAPMRRGVGAQRAAGYHQMSGTRHPKGQFVGALPTVVAYAP